MGGEYLITRVLTYNFISEVSQYEFDMENITVYPKHVTISNNKYECRGIAGLKYIDN